MSSSEKFSTKSFLPSTKLISDSKDTGKNIIEEDDSHNHKDYYIIDEDPQ
jgi:hypothetical protein